VVVAVAFPVSVTVAPLPPALTLIDPERVKVAAAAAEKLTVWLAPLIVSVVLDGVIETLRFLAARADVKLGVATGNIRAGAEAKLAAAGLDRWFLLGGYGCDSAVRAELVAAAIARAGDATDVIVVGDTIHDIAAARACGATVCAVATGTDSAEQLAHADVVFASMTELPAWHAARFSASSADR